MRGSSLQSELLARLAEAPAARSLGFYEPSAPVRWLSREEVYRRAVGAATQVAEAGVRSGDVCVIVLPSGELAATAILATLILGAVPLLAAPPKLVGGNLELRDTLHSVLRRTRARLAICAPSLTTDLPDLARAFPTTRFMVAPDAWRTDVDVASLAPVLPRAADVAAMQLTSGTTAAPRICVWDHAAVLAALDGMVAAMGLSSDDVCFNWTPLYHDMGLVNNFLLCLARGIPLALLSPQDFVRRPALWLRGLSETGATITWSPNFGFAIASRKVEDRDLSGVQLDHVRAFWNAAERIHLETIEAFHRRFAAWGVTRAALKTNYGCAENIGGATFSPLDGPPPHERVDRRLLDERGIARPVATAQQDQETVSVVSAGRPNPGVVVRILSARGHTLPDGRVGEICLETPSRMLRYHRNARDSRRALRGPLVHTGDLGYLREGQLFWVGRLRERITIQGKKIDPSAFESVLASIHGLREGCFVAFGVPDAQSGTERLVVLSEVRLDAADSVKALTATIRRECFLHLGIGPDDVVLVRPGTLAKTSSGKRRHRHFRKRYLDGGLEDARLALDATTPVSAPADTASRPESNA